MGFRFRRSIRLGKGSRLNLSKSGISVSQRLGRSTLNFGSSGGRFTQNFGGGVSYEGRFGARRGRRPAIAPGAQQPVRERGCLGCMGRTALIVVVVVIVVAVVGSLF